MPFEKGHKKIGGKKKGSTNKSTTLAREAIASFVDNNSNRFERLLDKIENGVQDDCGEWIERPDSKAAFDAITKVMEYHIPKLARTETNLTGDVKTIIEMRTNIPFAPNEKPKDDN